MPTLKLTPQEARDILYGDSPLYTKVSDEIVGNGSWSIHHLLVFTDGTTFYLGTYRVGSTESQDEQPWEWDKFADFTEVEPYEKTVTDYRPVKEPSDQETTI